MNIFNKIYDRLDQKEKIERDALAFRAAAIELQDTPPNPLGRSILWAIIILFVIAIVWASMGQIDIVATARGKVVPIGQTKIVQPAEKGVVANIYVTEGQKVNEGDLLIVLDGSLTQADVDRLSNELVEARAEKIRLKLFDNYVRSIADTKQDKLKTLNSESGSYKAFAKLGSDLIANEHMQLLRDRIAEYNQLRSSIRAQIKQKNTENRRNELLIEKLEKTLPILSARVDSLKKLLNQNYSPRNQFYELEQERLEMEQDLKIAKNEAQLLKASIEELESRLAAHQSEALSDNRDAIQINRIQVAGLSEELKKAEVLNLQREIKAPISGVVQQLAVHTVGGVVTPAEQLMQIVPSDAGLEIEAFVENKDIGFVAEGQKARVKIDTFNFTKYGHIDGELTSVSRDAVSDENQGLVYKAKVALAQSYMLVNGQEINLSPGMSVATEVKIGKRRVIEFFLSPLLRYKEESILER